MHAVPTVPNGEVILVWGQVLTPLLADCVALAELLNLSVPHFPSLGYWNTRWTILYMMIMKMKGRNACKMLSAVSATSENAQTINMLADIFK